MDDHAETGSAEPSSFRDAARRSMAAAHRPGSPLAGPYGRPFHVLVVPVPIGAFVMAFAFDVASKVVEGRPFGRGAAWLVALGIASAVVAAAFGLLDLRRITRNTPAWRTATVHLTTMGLATACYVVSFLLRRADETQYGNGTPAGALALGAVGLVLLGGGVWLGVRLAFGYGVRVSDEDDQLVGHVPLRRSDG